MCKTKPSILAAVHDTAKGLHRAGVMDQVTLREFDQLCLPPVEPLQPEKIKHIRETSRVSQAVFARLLNTSVSTVQKWEIGQKKPTFKERSLGFLRLRIPADDIQVHGSTLRGGLVERLHSCCVCLKSSSSRTPSRT